MIKHIALALILVACGKGGDKADKASSRSAAKPPVEIDVAAINALVPAALKDKIVFEKRDLVIERGHDKTTYTMAVPKNWVQDSKMWANLKADDKGGFFTTMKVGNDCDGECKVKEWEQIADKNYFLPRSKGKVLKDDKAPQGKSGKRTMIAEVDSGGAKLTEVVVAWWTEGDSNYHTCVASLDEAVKDAAPAFDKACQAVNIDGKD